MTERRKPGPTVDDDVVAEIVVDAALLGDDAAAARHGISTRTVKRYRARAFARPELARLVTEKKARAEERWADGLATALRSGIAFLDRAAKEADPKDPAAIHAVAGALKISADVALTSKMIDARLAGLAGQAREVDQPNAIGADGAPGDGPRTVQ